jgi:preprotein translocase subunit SecD
MLKQTALLEFVDMGTTPVPVGTIVKTDFGVTTPTDPAETTYHTVMTGAGLKTAAVTRSETGEYAISFTLKPDATDIFGEYTTSHQQQYLQLFLIRM